MHTPHFTFVRVLRLFVLAAFVFATNVFIARADSSCDDFLTALHKKPKDLEFRGCKQQTGLQATPFEASYRVAGIHAAEVESYLARELKVKKLKLNCCLWESTDNFYRDKEGRAFMLSMSTQETIISSRNQWAKIAYFYVLVDWYRDEP
jgi:Domian of unknown function (DUF4952)